MKILFVLEHFHPYLGGAEQLFKQLTKALVKNGHAVTVVTTRHDSSLPKQAFLDGVRIIRVNCFNRFGFTFFSFPAILRAARQCDLIHTTTYNAALPAFLSGKLLNKPVVITFHEVWGNLWMQLPFLPKWQRKLLQSYERLLLRLPFYRYIAVSKYTKDCLEQAGIPSKRIHTIYNGLDYSSFASYRPIPPLEFTYTYFGRLGISKGLNILLPAAKKNYAKYPKSKLQLVIPRYPKSIFRKIQDMIRKLELEDHISMLHDLPKQQLYQTLSRSSCVIIPSYSEGFCFAAAEAVALGVPIISSQKGALKEVVSGKYLTIAPLDADSLYNTLLKATRGEWDEKAIKIFPIEKTIEEHLKMYLGILTQKVNL